jgi:hypothetical protein
MQIREADQEAGRAAASFVTSRRSRILKTVEVLPADQDLSGQREPHPFVAGCGRWSEGSEGAKTSCGQCPHFGLRIGSYRCRIGSDCVCLRGIPMIARARMQFESHLGHA